MINASDPAPAEDVDSLPEQVALVQPAEGAAVISFRTEVVQDEDFPLPHLVRPLDFAVRERRRRVKHLLRRDQPVHRQDAVFRHVDGALPDRDDPRERSFTGFGIPVRHHIPFPGLLQLPDDHHVPVHDEGIHAVPALDMDPHHEGEEPAQQQRKRRQLDQEPTGGAVDKPPLSGLSGSSRLSHFPSASFRASAS